MRAWLREKRDDPKTACEQAHHPYKYYERGLWGTEYIPRMSPRGYRHDDEAFADDHGKKANNGEQAGEANPLSASFRQGDMIKMMVSGRGKAVSPNRVCVGTATKQENPPQGYTRAHTSVGNMYYAETALSL